MLGIWYWIKLEEQEWLSVLSEYRYRSISQHSSKLVISDELFKYINKKCSAPAYIAYRLWHRNSFFRTIKVKIHVRLSAMFYIFWNKRNAQKIITYLYFLSNSSLSPRACLSCSCNLFTDEPSSPPLPSLAFW